MMRAPSPLMLREAWTDWLDGARSGAITNRSGDAYKPSAIRSYESDMRLRVLPAFGGRRLSEIRRIDLQECADRLHGEGLSASSVQCTFLPLRALYRRALVRGEVAINPTTGLELPAVRSGRDRFASPGEAAGLLGVLKHDHALWATAMYAGLRRGELMALRANRIDLDGGVLRVEYGWDAKEGEIETKGRNDRRVPIASVLREPLAAHLLASGRRGDELVFGQEERVPFNPKDVTDAADTAWADAKLKRITLHECRHTFASLMIAAGVNAKALSTYMGHANISITLDRYGHLMPGNEEEAAGMLDAYLSRANTARASTF